MFILNILRQLPFRLTDKFWGMSKWKSFLIFNFLLK